MVDSSDHGAFGPGVMSESWPRSATSVANAGGIARHRPKPSGFVEPIATSTMHGSNRMMPSAPMLTPYAPNSPAPANAPRASSSKPNVNSATTRQITNPVLPAKRLSTSGVKMARKIVTMPRPVAKISPITPARRMTGAPPMPCARRAASARPTSCSTGRKMPGASTNTNTHSALSAP